MQNKFTYILLTVFFCTPPLAEPPFSIKYLHNNNLWIMLKLCSSLAVYICWWCVRLFISYSFFSLNIAYVYHKIPRILFVVVVCGCDSLFSSTSSYHWFAKLPMLCDYYCHLNWKKNATTCNVLANTSNRHPSAYANYSCILFYRHDHSWITSLCV